MCYHEKARKKVTIKRKEKLCCEDNLVNLANSQKLGVAL